MLLHTWQGAIMHQWAVLWRWLYLFEFQTQLSIQFHTSVISATIRFLLRDLLIKKVLNCKCMVIETRLRGPTRTIYYKINVLVSEVMALWKHKYTVSVHHIRITYASRNGGPSKKLLNVAWQMTALPDTPSTICSTRGRVNAMRLRECKWKK